MMETPGLSMAAKLLAKLVIQEAAMICGLKDQVTVLKQQAEQLKNYLQGADERQEMVGFNGIRELDFKADDVIDYYYDRVEGTTNRSDNSGWSLLKSRWKRIHDMHFVGNEIQSIIDKVGNLKKNGYLATGSTSDNSETFFQHQPYYPNNDLNNVVGLKEDIDHLVTVLKADGERQVYVLSIVGMGGQGKTTLANSLFYHCDIQKLFTKRAWVEVGQRDYRSVMSDILTSFSTSEERSEPHTVLTDKALEIKLRDKSNDTRYLIVLDDVWTKKVVEEVLRALPRKPNNNGSKVLITSRNTGIGQSLYPQFNNYTYMQPPLNQDNQWQLFSKIILGHSDESNIDESFLKTGMEMLGKCDGLPLAIIELAKKLENKKLVTDWHQVNEKMLTYLMESTGAVTEDGRVGTTLASSYNFLPHELQPCFLSLAMFPADCEIAVGKLTRMWLADNLVTAESEKHPEDVAADHLKELCTRSMVQVVRTNYSGDVKKVRLHKLMYHLCVSKAGQRKFVKTYEYSTLNDQAKEDAYLPMNRGQAKPRRVAIHSCTSIAKDHHLGKELKGRVPTQASYLRSLMILTKPAVSNFNDLHIESDVVGLGKLHHNYKMLKLLSLWGIKTSSGKLPSEIGSLINLRYLEVRATNIVELPKSIGNLKYLLTLDYRNIDADADKFIKIPNVFSKLELLRHLFLPVDWQWSKEELKITDMKSLRTFWGIKHEATDVSKLSPTLKKLKIVLETEKEIAACSKLMLRTFHCVFSTSLAITNWEPLSNWKSLCKLILKNIKCEQISCNFPPNLVVLELWDSTLVNTNLSKDMGILASLKLLRLSNTKTESELTSEENWFPNLEELYLDTLQHLEKLTIVGGLVRLRKLEITTCRNLKFPQGLTRVTTLQEFECVDVSLTFRKDAIRCGLLPKRVQKPHNYEAIIRKSDSPVNYYSMKKLYTKLAAGVLLNKGQKKYWVKEHRGMPGIYCNCFEVYASHMYIGDAWRPQCTEHQTMSSEDGISITLPKTQSSGPFTLVGKFSPADLSPDVFYKIVLMIKLDDDAPKPNNDATICSEFHMPGIIRRLNMGPFYLAGLPKNIWTPMIAVKELQACPVPENTNDAVLMFTFSQGAHLCGLKIRGFVIEPTDLRF